MSDPDLFQAHFDPCSEDLKDEDSDGELQMLDSEDATSSFNSELVKCQSLKMRAKLAKPDNLMPFGGKLAVEPAEHSFDLLWDNPQSALASLANIERLFLSISTLFALKSSLLEISRF